MPSSIEQSAPFNMARRLVRLVAPDFRVFATEELQQGEVILDLRKKTIEVAEGTPDLEAVAHILFQAGHLRLRSRRDLAEHFGKIQDTPETTLISALSQQGTKADRLAYRWAFRVLCGYWNVSPDHARRLISPYVWGNSEWEEYYKHAQSL